jgi:hypothetical protein
MGKLRIVIADDQTLFREGLQTILNLEEDMEVHHLRGGRLHRRGSDVRSRRVFA